jgi:nucleoside 2-deoxyribosyltransferase
LPSEALASLALEPVRATPGRVYLAGPFFTLPQRWLIEEARSHLLSMNLQVFSPFHDVGIGPAEVVAPADLEAFDSCDRMLAFADGGDAGTLFEIGYARARNVPVIVLAEAVPEEQMKMIVGSKCLVTNDFASAIYFTAWADV